MSYIGQSPEGDAAVNKYEYTATSGQTTFNCVYDSRVDVYLNGVLLSGTDYTASSGVNIVLGTGASAGDIVQIDAFQEVVTTLKGLKKSVEHTATSGQTDFSATYTPGYLDVFLNGVRLDDSDYTATNGTTVVLATGASAGDLVYIQSFQTFEVANALTDLVSDTTPQLGGNLDTNGKNINVGDSSVWSENRATFGWSSDLQIYHDGSNSFIGDYGGTGSLFIQTGDQLYLQSDHGENYIVCNKDGTVNLYHDNVMKLQTLSTGIDVTGEVSCDNVLNVNGGTGYGHIEIGGDSGAYIDLKSPFVDDYDARLLYEPTGQSFQFHNGGTERMRIDSSGNVGIGTTSPSEKLEVYGGNFKVLGSNGAGVRITDGSSENGGEVNLLNTTGAVRGLIDYVDADDDGEGSMRFLNLSSTGNMEIGTDGAEVRFRVGGTERMRIDSSGRVTMPYQPHIFGTPGNGTAGSSGNATQFSTQTSRGLSFSNNRITVPVAGVYLITFQTIMSHDAGSGRKDSAVIINGTNVSNGLNNASDGGNGDYKMRTHTFTRYLNANDYIQFNSSAWYASGNGFSNWQTASVSLLG